MRIITVEEPEFGAVFNNDRDAATRLGGHRLGHMDAVGIDMQVVSHGNGSPGTLAHPEAVELCREFLTGSGLSDAQQQAIGHGNIEALLHL